jgi:hypothetical protein
MSNETLSTEKIPNEKRKALPQKLRALVWNTYIGNKHGTGKCWCCKDKIIEQMDFHCGHVNSVKDGGTNEIINLRPVCAPCNLSMGTTNMIDFMKTLGTDKKISDEEPKKNLDRGPKIFLCEFCKVNFSHASGLSRHKKKYCLKKQEIQKNEQEAQKREQEIQEREQEIKRIACIEEQLKQATNQLKELKAQTKKQIKELKVQNQNLLMQLEKKDILLINSKIQKNI